MKNANKMKSMGLLSVFVVFGMLAAAATVATIPNVSALDSGFDDSGSSISSDLGGFGSSDSTINLGYRGGHRGSSFGRGGFGRHGGSFGRGGFGRHGGGFGRHGGGFGRHGGFGGRCF